MKISRDVSILLNMNAVHDIVLLERRNVSKLISQVLNISYKLIQRSSLVRFGYEKIFKMDTQIHEMCLKMI